MEKFIPDTRLRSVDHDPFTGPAIACTVPSTEAQREVFIASSMGHDASCAYNESVSLQLNGPLRADLVKAAVETCVQRHEGLRSVMSRDGLRLIVLEHMQIPFATSDLGVSVKQERMTKLAGIAASDMGTAFDLLNGPLLRVHLIRTGPEEHLLRITGHHVVIDGWSLGVLMADISRIYSALAEGHEPALPAPIPFSSYALALIDHDRDTAAELVKRYWRAQFKAPLPHVDLPTDRPRPAQKTFNGARFDAELPPHLTRGLREVATRNGSSFVTTLLTAFELLVYKLTGDPDVVVGLPAAGQSDMGMKDLIGHCVNLLPLRSRVDEERPFNDHLKERRAAVLDAYDHQRITFSTLLRELNVPREPGRVPLVPVVFNIDMNMDDGVAFTGLRHRFISNPRRYENFELFLNATGNDQRVVLEWSYNTDLFDQATIQRWMDDLSGIIARINAHPSDSIASVLGDGIEAPASLPPAEWAGQAVPYPKDMSVSMLFDETARAHGDRAALIQGDRRVSYSTLRAQVLRAADALRKAGVGRGDLVGLCCERDPSMVIAQLAILRCGAAFVPLDQTYPAERLRFLIEDTRLKLLLVADTLRSSLPEHSARVILLETVLSGSGTPSEVAPLDAPELPAYIMYTSGSTGKPKGVVVAHRGIIRLVRSQNYVRFGPDVVITQLSNISFDASTFELWGALLNGGTLVLQAQAKPTLQEITDTIERHGVNTMFITTALFNLLVDEQLPKLRKLKCILTGGEVMSLPHIRKALEALGPGVLHNIYGPTENTTFSSYHPINKEEDIGRAVPIGHAVHNTFLYVLDEQLQPVPIGVKGELFTGGDGVAIGYWERPELTAERFVHDPFRTGEHRMYRTGDMVRWLPNGALEFLGRTDDQVKVRGFRIEPGEIENAISAMDGVRDRIVVARKDLPSDKQLVAYIVPAHFDPDKDPDETARFTERSRKHLAQRLPEYMRPSFTVVLRELPLNANGKVDKRALPMPTARPSVLRARHVAPRDEMERALAEIWKKALGVDDLGVNDDFFELGGHSLMGLQLLTMVEQRFGVALPLKELFVMPNIARMADVLRTKAPQPKGMNMQAIQPEGQLPPIICVHGDEANYFLPKYLGKEQPFYGIFHQGEDGKEIRWRVVEEMATNFLAEVRATLPHGPYVLCGYSFGGLVAYEMAQQLRAAGEPVPVLVLFDTYDPRQYSEISDRETKWYQVLKEFIVRRVSDHLFSRGRTLPAKLRHNYIIGTYHRAILAYRAKPYEGPLTLVRAASSDGTDDMGWIDLAKGGLDVRTVPGDHFSLVKEPYVAAVADVLRSCIAGHQRAASAGVS